MVIYCQTTGVSAAHATHCATYCTPCRPLIREFSGWIRTPPPTSRGVQTTHSPPTPLLPTGDTDTPVYSGRRGEALEVEPSALPVPHGTLGSQGALYYSYNFTYNDNCSYTSPPGIKSTPTRPRRRRLSRFVFNVSCFVFNVPCFVF